MALRPHEKSTSYFLGLPRVQFISHFHIKTSLSILVEHRQQDKTKETLSCTIAHCCDQNILNS